MKWLKRLLLIAALSLALAAALSTCSWWLYRGQPAWYRPSQGSTSQRQAAARSAENKFIEARNWAEASVVPRQSAAHPLPASITITFTQDELNAFLHKWAQFAGFDEYVKDPMIALRENRLVLAGGVKELNGVIISLHFAPKLNGQGRLQLDLVRVLGGRLPLPEMLWATERDKVQRALGEGMESLQRAARIEPNGASNESAISAAMTRLVLHALSHEPADPLLFLPLLDGGRGVPVTLTGLNLADGAITLTAEPLAPTDRAALLQRIRQPYRPAGGAEHTAQADAGK